MLTKTSIPLSSALADFRDQLVKHFSSLVGTPTEAVDRALLAEELIAVYKDFVERAQHTATSTAGTTCVAPPTAELTLTNDQQVAWAKIQSFLSDTEPSFVLKGFAGTGKTYLMKMLASLRDCTFTAPTNKAVKVLRTTLNDTGSFCTIYSLLGVTMKASEDELVLTYPVEEKPIPDLVVVDESSQLNSELLAYLLRRAKSEGCKLLFVGDPAQLPPVGEPKSPVWKIRNGAMLKETVRFDSALLVLASHLRDCVKDPTLEVSLVPAPDVDVVPYRDFKQNIVNAVADGVFSEDSNGCVVAWRNRTVAAYNRIIRKERFGQDACNPWVTGDRILLAAPVMDGKTERLTIDDEGLVTEVLRDTVEGFKCWLLKTTITTVTARVTLVVLDTDEEMAYQGKLSELAAQARKNGRLWKHFWDLKNTFHQVRYAYAMTAHRAQGSTFKTAFVDAPDILANPTVREARRCLYVAATRASKNLVILA